MRISDGISYGLSSDLGMVRYGPAFPRLDMEGDFLPCDRKAYPAFDRANASRDVRQGDDQPAVRIERRARSIGKTEGADFAALRHQRFGGARDRAATGLAGKGGASRPDSDDQQRQDRKSTRLNPRH